MRKYRKRVLTGAVAARLEALIRQACEVKKWVPEEPAIRPDHAHLLIQAQPRDSVSQIMKTIKGGTSRVLRREFPGLGEYLYAPEGITSCGATTSGPRATSGPRWAWSRAAS